MVNGISDRVMLDRIIVDCDMRNIRIIPRLDIKMDWLIKGVQMEGWRKVGNPAEYAKSYANNGADELLFMDVVASLYERNNLSEIVKKVASSVFVPMTVGGGIRNVDDVSQMLSCGADKVALNTAATKRPELISEIANQFGSQATVVSIEAIRSGAKWLAMTDNGRNHTGRDVLEWAKEVQERGAGEIIVTSIDRDGLGKGFEIDLIKQIAESVTVPVIGGGGFGETEHLIELLENTEVSGLSIGQALHWKKVNLDALRATLSDNHCFVRNIAV